MIQPVAGLAMAALCGGHTRVKHALALGVVVPVPTCAILASEQGILSTYKSHQANLCFFSRTKAAFKYITVLSRCL
jgi:hypothetical protein